MKKALAYILCSVMLLPIFSSVVFAAEPVSDGTLKNYDVIYSENGRNISFEDSDGNIIESLPSVNASGQNKLKTSDRILKTSSVPSAYDSRDYDRVTPVRDQGNTGSCWAFSAIACLESDAIVKGYETSDSVDFSEAHLVWATYTASQDSTDPNCGENAISTVSNFYNYGGNADRAVLTLSKGSGLTDEDDYPYMPYDSTAMGNYSQDAYYANNGYTVGSSVSLADSSAVKSWIMDHGAASAAYYSDTNYEYVDVDGTYYCTYYSDSTENSNHAITLVGWDDNFSKENFKVQPSSDGAWLVKNSWGSDWGEDGYFWISYDEATLDEFWGITISKCDYEHTYSYNGATYSSMLSFGTGNFCVANVFETGSSEILDSVGYYSYTAGSTLNVSVEKLASATALPATGTVICTATVSAPEQGWYRISFGSDYTLDADSYYAVMVKVSSDSTVYAVIETQTSSYCNYTSSVNQSYYSHTGSGWYDFYSSGYGNAYVNLYTKCNHVTCTDTKDATCTEDGYSKTVCTVCGKVISDEETSALGHVTVTDTKAATCTEGGYVRVTCSRCGETISETITPATGHNLITESKQPTCTEAGYDRVCCSTCGEVISYNIIPATGHSYGPTTETSRSGGYIHYQRVCTECGNIMTWARYGGQGKYVSAGSLMTSLFRLLLSYFGIKS